MKIALITGGTKGIGFEITKQLLKKKYFVILTARSISKKLNTILSDISKNFKFYSIDFSELKQVINLCKK